MSKYRGVAPYGSQWRAYIELPNRKRKYFPPVATAEEAALQYDRYARAHGMAATCNFEMPNLIDFFIDKAGA